MNKQPRSWNRDAKTQDDFYQVIQAAQEAACACSNRRRATGWPFR